MASSSANILAAGPPTAPSSGTVTPASVPGDGQTPLTSKQKRNQRTKFRKKKAREAKRAGQNAGAAEDSDGSSNDDDDAGDATPGPTPRTPTARQNQAAPPTSTPKSKKAQGKEPAKEQNAGKSAPGPAPKTPTLAQQIVPSPSPTPKSARVQGKAPLTEQHDDIAVEKPNRVTIYPATPKVVAGSSFKTPTTQQNLPSSSATQPKSKKAQGKAPAKEEQSKGPNEPAEQTDPPTEDPATPKEPIKSPTAQPNLLSPTSTEPKSAKVQGQAPTQGLSRREKKRLRQQEREAQEAAEKGLQNHGADDQARSSDVADSQGQSVNVANDYAQSTNEADVQAQNTNSVVDQAQGTSVPDDKAQDANSEGNQDQSTNVADDQASDTTELGRDSLNEDLDLSATDTDTEAGDPPTQYVEQPITTVSKFVCDLPFRIARGARRILQWLLNTVIAFLILIRLLKETPIDEHQKAIGHDQGSAPKPAIRHWFWQRKAQAGTAKLESEKKGHESARGNRDFGASVEPVEHPALQASSWLRPWKRTTRADSVTEESGNAAPQAAKGESAPKPRGWFLFFGETAQADAANGNPEEAAADDQDTWPPVGEPTPIARGLSWLWTRIARRDPAVAGQGSENAVAVPSPAERDEQTAQDQNAGLAWEPATVQDLEDFLHCVLQPPWLIFTYAMRLLAGLWRRKGLITLAILIWSSVYIPLCTFTDLPSPTDSSYLTDFYDDPSFLDDLVSSLAKLQDVTISTASTEFVPNEAFLKAQNLQMPSLRGELYATEREDFVNHFIRTKVAVDEALSEFDRRSAAAGEDLLDLARPDFESKKRGTKKFLRNLSHLLKQQAKDMDHIGVSLEKIPPLLTNGDTLRQLDDVYRQRAWFQWPFYDLHTRHVFRDNLKSLEKYYVRQTDQMERASTTSTALREDLSKQRGWGLIDTGIEENAWMDVAEMIEEMLRVLDRVGAWNRRFSHGN
ncbi:MAG: hypothetical protein Q9212_003217 [Teloschistes hypoglaucus]